MRDLIKLYAPYIGRTLNKRELDEARKVLECEGFSRTLGIVYDEISPDRVVAHLDVGPQFCQPMGIVHGGIYASLVEDVGSLAAWWWLGGRKLAVGSSNDTDFLRPVTEGHLTATATPLHRGRTQQIWIVDIVRDDGKQAAQGKLHLANLSLDSLPDR